MDTINTQIVSTLFPIVAVDDDHQSLFSWESLLLCSVSFQAVLVLYLTRVCTRDLFLFHVNPGLTSNVKQNLVELHVFMFRIWGSRCPSLPFASSL